MYYIKELILETEQYKNYTFSEDVDKVLSNISKINIFVGSNNSGKSRFLRQLVINDCERFIPKNLDMDGMKVTIEDLKTVISAIMQRYNIVDYGGINSSISSLQSAVSYIDSGENYLKDFFDIISTLENINGQLQITTRGIVTGFYQQQFDQINNELRQLGNEYRERMELITEQVPLKFIFDKIYIPTLRGLRPLHTSDDLYFNRTQKDYFANSSNVKIFTGLNLYDQLRSLLLGNLEDREKISNFQRFLSQTFFNGDEVALIPSINSDVVYVKIGYEKEQPIYNLGDGIQSIIIIKFPLFMNIGKNMLVYIEEPELYLHPGLQRKLLETFIMPQFEGYQYFITTHSNHFLDITLDIDNISIYSFSKKLDEVESREKEASFIIDNMSNENNSVLEMLGVKNSSVFMSNCTIWVEGITDRYYIRHYLNLYQNSLGLEDKDRLKEDYHFSFVEYSGNNITHWSFLDDEIEQDGAFNSMNVERLCSKLFLITDKDSEKKLSRQQKLEQKLQERYYCLDCKEIENLIKLDVLKKVIADYENVPVDQLQFSAGFTEANYKNKYLGKIIQDKLRNKRRRGSYAQDSGTIKDKVKFCEKAIKFITGFDDLSDDAKELARKTYDFIKSNNV